MNDNYVSYMGWVVWDGWCEMSGVRWVVWSGAPQPFLEALSIDTATPNIVYTQQAAKPACQEDTNATFSHLLLAQLPRTQFTHSKLPNPHSRKTSPFLEALSTAPATHTRAADQQDINATFSYLLLAQLPPTTHAKKTSTQHFRISYWHSYPKYSLHTATCQTPMPGDTNTTFSHLLFAQLPQNTIYIQQPPKPPCQEDITFSRGSEHCAGLTDRSRRLARHQHKSFTPSITTTTPNTVYTKQTAKPACQEDTNATFSHLLLAQLPQTQFTHSNLPNPHARKTSPFLEALSTAPATQTGAADQRRPGAQRPFLEARILRLPHRQEPRIRRAATLSRGSEYCACHADRSRGPAATRRAATLSSGLSTAPATQTGAADQRRPGAPQPFLEALITAPATQTGAADQRRPGAPQPFLEALKTAPATQTRAADQRRPGFEYCACHTEAAAPATQTGAADQRRPGAPQPFLEALSTAPTTQTGAADQRRPGAPQPFLEALNTAPATQTRAADQRRPGAQQPSLEALSTAPATQTGAAEQRRPGAPQPFLEALSTAPATQTGAADQRRPGAPQPFLEALNTAPATQTRAADQRRPGPEYCACHTDRSRGPAATRRAATLSRGSQYSSDHWTMIMQGCVMRMGWWDDEMMRWWDDEMMRWWDEMRWDEMRWDEMRWDEMRWDEMRWDEMRGWDGEMMRWWDGEMMRWWEDEMRW